MLQENLRGGLSFQSQRCISFENHNTYIILRKNIYLNNEQTLCSFFINSSYFSVILRYEESSSFEQNEDKFCEIPKKMGRDAIFYTLTVIIT